MFQSGVNARCLISDPVTNCNLYSFNLLILYETLNFFPVLIIAKATPRASRFNSWICVTTWLNCFAALDRAGQGIIIPRLALNLRCAELAETLKTEFQEKTLNCYPRAKCYSRCPGVDGLINLLVIAELVKQKQNGCGPHVPIFA